MTPTQVKAFQIEYETSDITISDLCTKYKIDQADLEGHQGWEKRNTTLDIFNTTPASNATLGTISLATNKEELQEQIDSFKYLAVHEAITNLKENKQFMEVKEFKDLVTIVNSVEDSIKDKGPTTINNIQLQFNSLIGRYSDDNR